MKCNFQILKFVIFYKNSELKYKQKTFKNDLPEVYIKMGSTIIIKSSYISFLENLLKTDN